MITINLNDELSQAVELMAAQQHKPVSKLVEQLLTELLEDYNDARIAEQALEDIHNGKSEVLSLAEARQLYDKLAG